MTRDNERRVLKYLYMKQSIGPIVAVPFWPNLHHREPNYSRAMIIVTTRKEFIKNVISFCLPVAFEKFNETLNYTEVEREKERETIMNSAKLLYV